MMNSFRRVFSSPPRQLFVIPRNTCSFQPHRHFPSVSSLSNKSNSIIPHSDFTPKTFLLQLTRGFTKRCNTTQTYDDNNDDEDGGTYGGVDFGNAVKYVALSQMEAALEALPRDLVKLPTGRAPVGMLDHIFVIINGVKIALNKMAAVSSCGPCALYVTPYYPNTLKELEKAIDASQLGLYFEVKEERLLASTYPLREGDMQAVCKLVINSCEHAKASIRRVRQKTLHTIEKNMPKKKKKEKTSLSISCFSADDVEKLKKEVDEMTKKYIKSVEDMCNSKKEEIFENKRYWWWCNHDFARAWAKKNLY